MIRINLDKAKDVAHNIRRQKRAEEFAPHDAIIAKQIPGTNFAEVESARQSIRDKYAAIQSAIDGASNPDEIKIVLQSI